MRQAKLGRIPRLLRRVLRSHDSGGERCMLSGGLGEDFILWLTGVAAIPLPRAVLFRQAVTRYDFLWLEQPTPAPT